MGSGVPKTIFDQGKRGAGISKGPLSSSFLVVDFSHRPALFSLSCCLFIYPSVLKFLSTDIPRQPCGGGGNVRYGFINMQRNPIDGARLFPFRKNRFLLAQNFIRPHKICFQNIHPIQLSISNIWETPKKSRLPLPNSSLLMIHRTGFRSSSGIGILSLRQLILSCPLFPVDIGIKHSQREANDSPLSTAKTRNAYYCFLWHCCFPIFRPSLHLL
jgi:hypothetical protein